MRILFLNQYFPPDPAPTGILLRQVGDAMVEAGHRVEYVAAGQDYRIRNRGFRRLARELQGLWEILRRGVSAERPDLVFSATSPPCLLAVATMIAKRHEAKSVHWAMDLYPELASTLGEIPAPVAFLAGSVMKWSYRHTDLVVGLDADMVERLARHGVQAEAIRPWILGDSILASDDRTETAEPSWIYSGNLGRAHEWKTLLDAQAILESRSRSARLVFQGSGPSREKAQEYAERIGLKRCDWLPYAPEPQLVASLLRARVLVATQRPETRGLLWPSKLAMLLRLPRPLLWVGPVEGAIAADLRNRKDTGIFAPGSAEPVANWLEQQLGADAASPATASPLETGRAEGSRWWVERITRLVGLHKDGQGVRPTPDVSPD